MSGRRAGYALLTVLATCAAIYTAAQMNYVAGAPIPTQLKIQVELDPGEKLLAAAAGNLTGSFEPSLVFGTSLPDARSRIRVLQWQKGHYETVWAFTEGADNVDLRITSDVHNGWRGDLITLWYSGAGAYLDVRIFEWNGRTFQETWHLPSFKENGQLTQGASLEIRPIGSAGNIELMIRAPNVLPGASTHGLLSHQVSMYRWDTRRQTFVLFKRFVDTNRSFE